MNNGYFEVSDINERDPKKLFPSFLMYEKMKNINVELDKVTEKIGIGPDSIKIIENFISEEEINFLLFAWHKEKPFLSENELKGINLLIKNIKEKVKNETEKLFHLTLKEDDNINTPHNETFYILKRHENFVTDIHCDNFGDDKNLKYMWNGYLANLIYLNDNYTGGELYFPEYDLTIKPKKGMLISFPGNFFNRHGIFPAIGDGRFAMSIFLKFEDFE